MPNLKRAIPSIILLMIAMWLRGQENPLQTKVTINAGNISIKQALIIIEENYSVRFTYSDNILPQGTATIHFENQPLYIVLDSLTAGTKIAFKTLNQQIVLYIDKNKTDFYCLSGFISDEKTGENLIGVTIYCESIKQGTVSNAYGFYSLKLPEGPKFLTLSCLGYEQKKILARVSVDTGFNFTLKRKSVQVEEVKVTKNTESSQLETTQMNTSFLNMQDIRLISGLFGENDVSRNIGLLPGIQTSEISSGNIYVRGGGADQVIFLMDEAKIYNASHFGGMFSVFNPDIVNSVEVFKGDMPSENEGAISSLINVHLIDGNYQNWKVRGSLGLISAKALIEGPVKKEKSSVLFAFRRSYVDALLQLMKSNIKPSSANYYFYDANLKYNNRINSRNRIYLSVYAGNDNLLLLSSVQRSNQMFDFRWNHVVNSRLFCNTSVIFSRNYMQQITGESNVSLFWNRDIYNINSKIDFSYYISPSAKANFGISSNSSNITPFSIRLFENNNEFNNINVPKEYLYINSLYADFLIKPIQKLEVETGLRTSYFYNPRAYLHSAPGNSFEKSVPATPEKKYTDVGFSPRIYAKFLISNDIAIKAGYDRLVNPLHQLQVSDIGITVNRWMPATKGFRPQISNNFSIGFFSEKDKWLKLSLEAYYRNMSNLIETLHDQNVLLEPVPDQYLYKAKGKASGIEFSATIAIAKLKLLTNYSHSRVLWKTAGLNDNNFYPAPHSHPDNINILATYSFTNRFSVTSTWSYYTGSTYTPASARYILDGKTMIYFDNQHINSNRLPDYHRLDLSFDLAGRKNNTHKWKSYWNLSIYNVYMHKNPYSLIYFTTDNNSGSSSSLYFNPQYLYFYQFVPSITYRFEF